MDVRFVIIVVNIRQQGDRVSVFQEKPDRFTDLGADFACRKEAADADLIEKPLSEMVPVFDDVVGVATFLGIAEGGQVLFI